MELIKGRVFTNPRNGIELTILEVGESTVVFETNDKVAWGTLSPLMLEMFLADWHLKIS